MQYISVPASVHTHLILRGRASGSFTLDVEKNASSLAIDRNGDGTTDSVVLSDESRQTVSFATLKNAIITFAVYDKKKNKTTVLVKKKGTQIQTQTLTGLRVIKLITNKGVIGYEL